MKKNYLLSFALLLGGLTFSSVADNVLYVSSSGNDSNDGTTATTALKSVAKAASLLEDNTPTTIYVEENATFDALGPNSIIIGDNKNVTLIGRNTTLLSGEKPYLGSQILRIGKNTNAKISGFVFTNGCSRDGIPGGAIFFEGEQLEVDSCTFFKNEANNSGSAIASCGNKVIVTNSVFDSNRIFGGYASAAVIYHAGLPNAPETPGSLIIRNCAFTNNESKTDARGDIIGFNFAYRDYPSADNKYTHLYSNVNYFELVNCVFKDNIPGGNSSGNPGSDIYIKDANVDNLEINLINNTFYKTRVLAIPFYYGTPYRLINNVFYNTGSYSIKSSNTSDERDALIAYNNVFVGDALGENMDDPAFTSEKEAYGNQLLSDVNQLGLTPRWENDNYVPYIPITATSSILIDKGLATAVSTIDGVEQEIVPATDIRGIAVSGNGKDIGAFEYTGTATVSGPKQNEATLFSIFRNEGNAVVRNLSEKKLRLEVKLLDGRTIYCAELNNEVFIDKSELEIANGVLIFTASDGKISQTVKTILF